VNAATTREVRSIEPGDAEVDTSVAEALPVDTEMRGVFAHAGYPTSTRDVDGIVETRMDIREETP
jgi:hypothetical protein